MGDQAHVWVNIKLCPRLPFPRVFSASLMTPPGLACPIRAGTTQVCGLRQLPVASQCLLFLTCEMRLVMDPAMHVIAQMTGVGGCRQKPRSTI